MSPSGRPAVAPVGGRGERAIESDGGTGAWAIPTGGESGMAAAAPGAGRCDDGTRLAPIREGCPPALRDGMLAGPSTPERRHPR